MSIFAGIVETLALDVNPYRQGFMQAGALAQTFPAIVTNFLANPLLGLAEVARQAFAGVTTAISAGFGFIIESVKFTADQADQLFDMSENVGVSVEVLHGLGLAAQQAGSSVAEVSSAFKLLGKNVAEAIDKDGAERKMFDELGIAIVDVHGKVAPLDQIMAQVSDTLAAMEDPGRRTHVAMSLLGRSGSELVSALSQGTGALRDQIDVFKTYGAVVTTANARAADSWGDLWGEVRIAWQGIKMTIGEPIIEGLTPVLKNVVAWMQQNSPWLRGEITRIVDLALKKLGEMAAWFTQEMPRIRKEIKDTYEEVKKFFSVNPKDWFGKAPADRGWGSEVFMEPTRTKPTLNMTVVTPHIDPKEASSEIARKLLPVMKQVQNSVVAAAGSAARMALVRGGI